MYKTLSYEFLSTAAAKDVSAPKDKHLRIQQSIYTINKYKIRKTIIFGTSELTDSLPIYDLRHLR